MLVLIGATPQGTKELIGFQTSMRESAQSWKELLVDLKFPTTLHQRCWLHKTLNVLDKLPKSVQPIAHKDLREIWLVSDRATAEAAMTTFARK